MVWDEVGRVEVWWMNLERYGGTMANEEHLKILKQGVEVWNRWRKEHTDEEIDLGGVNMGGADLSEADLRGANLSKADLSKADLSEANLQGANLQGIDLQGANLVVTNLNEAHLKGANLNEADLKGANLNEADLKGVNLNETNLNEANLRGADLRGARLILADLSYATITCANLYGTARDDWIIDGIKCDYVFWDAKPHFNNEEEEQEKQWELEHRTPKDRDFRPGEFEELYKQLPTFEYYFEHGFTALDAVVMSRIVEAINEEHPEFELKLDSFHSRGQPHAKFTVLHKDVVEEALKQVTVEYEVKIKALEAERNLLDKFLTMAIKEPRTVIKRLAIAEKGELTMGDKHIGRDNIEISGQAQVTNLTTGASFQGDYAQQLLQSTTPQSSKEDILKLLSFVQQELPKLPLPDDVKEEVTNEVKGAEIQAKKEEPDKKKIGEKLQNATEALEKVPKLTKAAVTVGNLLGQAILWCGMKWVEWKYGG